MKKLKLKEQKGFTLVELMVALVVFGLAMAAATSSFLPLVGHFTQQSKIAETQMESIISLDVLRNDIEQAGYGLPQSIMNGGWNTITNYKEAEESFAPASAYNDALISTGTFNPPRAIVLGNDIGKIAVDRSGINDSDYLVIKSTLVRKFSDAGKWTYMKWDKEDGLQVPHDWDDDTRDISEDSLVTVMKTVKGENERVLVASTASDDYYIKFKEIKYSTNSPFHPTDPLDTYLVYAVGAVGEGDSNLRMPFNRADYYINAKVGQVPIRCAPGTGVLMKAVLQHDRGVATDGKFGTYLPLFDCVADMQIILGLDMDEDGTIGTYTSDGDDQSDGAVQGEAAASVDIKDTLNDAALLRARLKEVRVYILYHEGQRDPGFSYNSEKIDVGEFSLGHVGANAFDLKQKIGDPDYKYYRWKVSSMVIKPENLR